MQLRAFASKSCDLHSNFRPHSDRNCFTFQDSDDSGLSSSPSSPAPVGVDFLGDLFDLDTNFSNLLNTSLFDGEFPSKLYTHIKIKDDDDEDMWLNASSSKVNTKTSSLSAGDSSTGQDYFDDSFELIAELLNPQPEVEEKMTGNSSKGKNLTIQQSAEISEVESKNNEACTPTSESGENSSNNNTISAINSPDTSVKRELRTRRKRVVVNTDHDYCRQRLVSDDEPDSDDDYKFVEDIEKEESDDSDDEDFKAPCPAKKVRKASAKGVKDSKYWERRQRNNLAAKRSREAKRTREIQVAKKTVALEKENANLKKQVRKLKANIKRAEKMLRLMV